MLAIRTVLCASLRGLAKCFPGEQVIQQHAVLILAQYSRAIDFLASEVSYLERNACSICNMHTAQLLRLEPNLLFSKLP